MKTTIIGVLAGAAVLAGGCGTASHQGHEGHELAAGSSPSIGTPTSGTASPSGPETGGLKRAAQVALAAVPGSVLVSIETEESGRLWEVQVVEKDGTEHRLDVAGEKVVNGPATEDADADDKAERRDQVAAAKLDYAQAAEKILATVPEGRLTELNLDTERDRTVWEADVLTPDGTKHKVAVDAATGEVVRNDGTTT
ncbi:metallopeptidase [Nonomuraea sp. KC401]|uniref:PepSY domain-containing protein n=1 Tax=unclassified Nonomuraea TaxID=2593643 RepID=UPI0010FDA146|nr:MULTISPECIES: PepSY domain-containing protein [unclassified Nonomuraea]NBE98094.1 metallopeptidase [Nonomuraea sp. K271]TLF56870.1 metallopeptidase [Nonomuraea sp. KC401]